MTERAGGRVHAARRAGPEPGPEPPWDASDGDLAEQRRPADAHPDVDELAPDNLPAEADPADALDQQLAVPAEPDEYR